MARYHLRISIDILYRKERVDAMRGRLLKRWIAALGLTLTTIGPVWAFGGEDPLNGHPWHHQEISELGMKDAGFDNEAVRETIGWHADYVDSYLYNPLWWAKGGLGRFRMALAMQDELEKVHFDDLFSSDQVRYMWRRYVSGTVAGLLWARDNNNDIRAAQNILGVSLHAIQDFYSHSNWVDARDRRTRTFFQAPISERSSLVLYTGAYELAEQLGIKHHGAYSPAASIMMQPGVSQLLEIASSGFSPLQNMPIMETYRKVKNNSTDVQPYIPFLKDNGIHVPANIIYLAPPGIALDSTWMAEIGTRVRGITDATPGEMFNTARGLAIAQTTQWLKRVEWAMNKAGAGDFWNKVKTTPYTEEQREATYEDYKNFAFTFMSAGPYPPPSPNNSEEYYLRLQIKTSNTTFSGTNSDIYLKVGGTKFMLDHMPRSMPILGYDDFEAGGEAVYWAGPFTSVPTSITLHNDSGSVKETLKAFGRIFTNAGKKIGDLAMNIIAGHADWIATNKMVWMPEDLEQITSAGKSWEVDLNGGDQGHYRVSGTISRQSVDEERDEAVYKVTIANMKCIKESKWDRGSNSDEPFLMALASSLPGGIQQFMTDPFDDVDKNETCKIQHEFLVQLPRRYGVLNLPLSVMEHDDESRNTRQKLLDAFAGKTVEDSDEGKRGFLACLDSARASDWKVERLKVYAWSRNGVIRQGQVMDRTVNQWIDGGDEASYNLHTPGLVQYPITTDQLLVEEGTTPSEPEPNNPNTPGTPAPATPSEAQLNNFLKLKGTWKTNKGTFLTVIDAPTLPNYSGPKLLYGKAITNPGGAIPDYKESAYFRLAPGFVSVEGDFTAYPGSRDYDYNSYGMVYVTLSADGDKFAGKIVLKGGNEYVYTGERVVDAPGIPGTPGSPSAPGVGAIGSWVSLSSYVARVDRVQPGIVPQTLDVFLTYKNPGSQEIGLTASSVAFLIYDREGIGLGSKGNLYSAEGSRPEPIDYNIHIQPGAETKVRYVVDLPKGTAPLYRLSLQEHGTALRLIDLTKLPPANGYVPPMPVANVIPAPNPKFMNVTNLDIRLDSLRKTADGQFYEGFFSIRNATKNVQGLPNYRISLVSENGAAIRTDGNLYRWSGDPAERIQHSVWMLPGEIAKVRYRFVIQRGMPAFTKLTLQEGNGPIQWVPLPVLP